MKLKTLLFLTLLSTCASAQIDSTYQIGYPFKMEITDVEILGGIFIDLVEITGADGAIKKFCRVSTTNYASSLMRSYSTILNKKQTETLIKRVNDWYMISQGGSPEVYTEYIDFIQEGAAHLHLYYWASGPGKDWTMALDADRFLKRGRCEVNGAKQMKKLNDGLKKCLSML
jgi:hypothetical protein